MKKVIKFAAFFIVSVSCMVIAMEEKARKKELMNRFFETISNNNVKQMTAMMKESPFLAHSYGKPKGFFTKVAAVHVAAAYGHHTCLKRLNQHFSMTDDLGNTPLHYTQDIKCAKELCSRLIYTHLSGAKNYKGQTPFMTLVLDDREVKPQEISSSSKKRYATAQWILDAMSIGVDAVDSQHRSCLYYAVARKDVRAIEFLLCNGAHATKSCGDLKSPFQMALECGGDIAHLFEQYGYMFISAQDKSYSNPFITLRSDAQQLKQLVSCNQQSSKVKRALNGIARLFKCVNAKKRVNVGGESKLFNHDMGIISNKNGWFVINACREDLEMFFGQSAIPYAIEAFYKEYSRCLSIISDGNQILFKQYLKDYPFLVEWEGMSTLRLLQDILTLRRHKFLKMILENYSDSSRIVNGTLSSGESPLQYAIKIDDAHAIALLIKHGAEKSK